MKLLVRYVTDQNWQSVMLSVLLVFQLSCAHRTEVAKQDLRVFRHGGDTVVKGLDDERLLRRDGQADRALQWAIDQVAAHGGGKIEIGSGEFVIEKPVHLASFVTLTGSGRATILKLGPENKEGVVLLAEGKQEVVLSDFTCQGIPGTSTSAGVVFDSVGDSEIRNVTARDFSGYGIWVRNNGFMNKVLSCTTLGNGRAGIYLSHNTARGRGGDFVPNLVEGCMSMGDKGNGVELSEAICTNIVACVVYQPRGYGFYFHNFSCSTLLSGSRCFQGAKGAILVEDSHEINVSSNTMCWNRGPSLELNHVVWGTVSGNNFIDSGATPGPLANGVYIHTQTKGVEVTGNAIWNWPQMRELVYGVYESPDCLNNQILGNNINNFIKGAVFSSGKNTTVADNKSIPEVYWIGPTPKPNGEEKAHIEFPAFTNTSVDEFLNLTRR